MTVKRQAVYTGHQAAIYALLPHENSILTGGGEGYIAAWQPLQNTDAQLVAQVPEAIFCLCFAAKFLLAGGINGNLYVIDIETKRIVKNIIHHQKGLFAAQYDSETNQFISAGGDGRLTFWDTNNWLPTETLQLSAKSLRCFERSRHATMAAIGDSLGRIFIVDTAKKTIRNVLINTHLPSVFVVRFSPCGNYLFSGGRDACLKIWDINDNFSCTDTISAHLATINDLQFSPNGEYFATASRDKTIKLWETKTHSLLKVIDLFRFGSHKNSVNRIVWQGNQTLFSVSDDRTLCCWSIEV